MNNIYFCYSKKLHYFLMGLGESYISSNINKNTGVRYWTFQKSQELDKKIKLYNSVKYEFK